MGLIGAVGVVTSLVTGYVIKLVMGLRVSLEDETQGIDIAEFGETAYTFDNYQQLSSEGVR